MIVFDNMLFDLSDLFMILDESDHDLFGRGRTKRRSQKLQTTVPGGLTFKRQSWWESGALGVRLTAY